MPERNTPLNDIFAPVRRRLANTAFARIEYVEQTGSTNEDAAARLDEAQAGGLTLIADYQTSGHGRKGRTWNALPGTSLLFTTILPRDVPGKHLWTLPFWTASCVAGALRDLGITTQLQWPNDLLLNNRKCCGILCLSRVIGEKAWVACGVGLNVHRPSTTVEPVQPPASYLSDVQNIDRPRVLAAVLTRFANELSLLDYPAQVARNWERAAALAGTIYRLQVDRESGSIQAIAQALGPTGELIVSENGRLRIIALADARVVRS